MEAQALIKKYGLTAATQDGLPAIKVANPKSLKARDMVAIREQKEEILAILHADNTDLMAARREKQGREAAYKAERDAATAAQYVFYVSGWESHSVSVDTRYDLKPQFVKIAEYYVSDGITPESAEDDYNRAIASDSAKKEAAVKAAQEYIKSCEGKTLPTYAQAYKESKEWQERNQSNYFPPVGYTVEGLAHAKRVLSGDSEYDHGYFGYAIPPKDLTDDDRSAMSQAIAELAAEGGAD